MSSISFLGDGESRTLDSSLTTVCSSDYGAAGTAASYLSCYEKYSERSVWTVESGAVTVEDNDQFRFLYDGTTVADLQDLISNANGTAAYTYINYDFRAFNGGKNDMNYYMNFTVGDSTLYDHTGASDYGDALDSVFNTGLVGTASVSYTHLRAHET